MGIFGSKKKKSTLAGRVKKAEARVEKKKRVAALKQRLEAARKKLRGY